MSAAPHLLIIRRRYLGDIVLLGSLLRNLKLHWPAARLAVLCEPAYAPILDLNPDVDAKWLFPQSVREWPSLLWRLRRAGFTHVIDLDNRDKTALLTRATGAAVRLTQRHAEKLHLPSFYTQHELLPREFLDTRHITDLYLRPLEKLGVPLRTRECRIIPRANDVAAGRALLRGASLLVHPGSRSAWRIWPPANYARVLDTLHRTHGITAAIIGGPGEQATVDEISRLTTAPLVRIEQRLSVTQLAGLFAATRILLCHDSGPMHVAAASGTRVVALFGSQPMNIWMPVGERHTTLQPPLPCVNCVSPGQCTPDDSYHNHCVRHISVERVLAAVSEAVR